MRDLDWEGHDHRKGRRRICSGEVGRLVLTHPDRPPRPRRGSELVFTLSEHFGTEVFIVHASEDASGEEARVQDELSITAVFSARRSGSRSDKNARVLDA